MDSARKRVLTISLLVLTVVGGFALRTAVNMDEAQTEEGQYVLSGNDPYYHKRAVDHIVETGETLKFDSMLNYPLGSVNPNPPLYEWSIAVGSQIAEPFVGNTEDATWLSTLFSPAVYGALTIIPAFLIGRMFAGNWAGLLGAFLVATSPEHMSRSSLGFADHDAAVLFFVTTGFYFLLTALRATGRPTDQTQLGGLASRFGEWFTENRRAAGSTIIAGASFGAIALMWKGFPYIFGILAAYAGLQFLVNHYQSRDVARPAFIVVGALSLAALMALPYYASFGLLSFWSPAFYILAAVVVLSVYFIAVQRYPSVLVVPGLVVLGGIFVGAMFLVFPGISQSLLGRLSYFQQNVLYETIAEARAAGFSNLSFTVGPIPFFMYVGGIFALMYKAWDEQTPAVFFFLTWSAVDLFLGISAIRFLSLIVPSMAILASVATVWLIKSINLPSLTQAYKRAGGRIFAAFNPVYGVIGAFLLLAVVAMVAAGSLAFYLTAGILVYGYLHFLVNDSLGFETGHNLLYISSVLFLGLLIIGPNAALGVDAAVPAGFEQRQIQQARSQALEDVTEKANELELSQEAVGEFQSAVNDSRSKEDFRSAIEDARIRLGLSESTTQAIYDAGKDEFDTISFYRERMGAFGQSFLPGGWNNALQWLSTQDTELSPEKRPAQVAWWDYGHWTINVGQHPAVADNFQNGYKMAGHWLVSQTEAQSVQLYAARQAQYFKQAEDLELDQFEQTLVDRGISEEQAESLTQGMLSKEYPVIEFSSDPEENLQESVDWVQEIEEMTDKKIRYGAADNRMLPIDQPCSAGSRRVENPSIYYAPVTLAKKEQKDYVETVTVNMNEVSIGGQRISACSELSDEQVRELTRQQSGQQQQPQIGRELRYKDNFFNSMYYRAYLGLPVNEPQQFRGRTIPQPFNLQSFEEFYRKGEPMLIGEGPITGTALLRQPAVPGFGLDHHRLVYANDAVRILRFYPGAEVSGQVTLAGEPVEGLRVTAFDDAGAMVLNASQRDQPNATPSDFDVPHDSATTEADGSYSLTAPFSTTERGVELRVTQNEASGGPSLSLFGGGQKPTFTITNETLDISVEETEQGAEFNVDFAIEPATVEGTAFHDVNRNGELDADEDRIRNATVTVGNRTVETDASGDFRVTNITPGRRTLTAEAADYDAISSPELELQTGAEVTQNATFRLESVPVNATVQDEQGQPVPNVQVKFNATEDSETAQNKTGFSQRNGTVGERSGRRLAALSLQPGEYLVSGSGTNPRTEQNYTVTGFAVTNGTGVEKTSDGTLQIQPDAKDVQMTIRVETSG